MSMRSNVGLTRWFLELLVVTIRPTFEERPKAVMARSISGASRTLIGLTSTLSDGVTAWIAPNWPIPPVRIGSRRTATRDMLGTICLSSSSHFQLLPNSKFMKPVASPPGRAKLLT